MQRTIQCLLAETWVSVILEPKMLADRLQIFLWPVSFSANEPNQSANWAWQSFLMDNKGGDHGRFYPADPERP